MPENMTPEERQELIAHVRKLSQELHVSQEQRTRTEKLAEESKRLAVESHEQSETNKKLAQQADKSNKWLKGITALLVVLVFVLGYFVNEQRLDGQDLQTTQQAIQDAQITNCQNANKTREGQRALWDFIIETSVQSNPDAPPVVKDFYRDLAIYTHDLFAERDCSDLDKEYDLPVPPRIPTPDEIEGKS